MLNKQAKLRQYTVPILFKTCVNPSLSHKWMKAFLVTFSLSLLGSSGLGQNPNGRPSGSIPPSSLPIDAGELVVTCCSGIGLNLPGPNVELDPNGSVVALVDVRDPDPAYLAGAGLLETPPVLFNWRAPMFHNENAGVNTWNARNLGQVFGLALDDQPNPNIYVAASTIYGEFNGAANAPNYTFGPGGSGAIYRLDGVTGQICLLAQLPNNNASDPRTGTGLGNLAFSPVGDYLYVSNMDDGLIYRVPVNPCPNSPGTVYLTFDHGVGGRIAEGLSPILDNPNNRYTQLGRRVWGLAVNESERRLYYSVWWEHGQQGIQGVPAYLDDINPTEDNEIWSVTLDNLGAFVPGSARREFWQPPLHGGPMTGYSNPASDLSFSPVGNLLIAERTRTGNSGQRLVGGPFDAHQSRLLQYTGSHLSWTASPTDTYLVGGISGSGIGWNGAGGSVADCDENVWSSGDALASNTPDNFVYGIQRLPAGGNATDIPPQRNTYMIDLNDETQSGGGEKTEFGDVAIHNQCCNTEPVRLCDLIDFGGSICSGEKIFWDFSYSPIGDMPDACDILVIPIEGGIRFQGAFLDLPGNGASDALIDFKVIAPDGYLISPARLSGNPLVIGDGFFVVTETFLPTDTQTELAIYDIQPDNIRQLLDESDLTPPVQIQCVQKDIIALATTDTSLAVMSFLDQTFECIPDPDREMDWGDLPDSYGTSLASNGARHVIGGPFLGATIDAEPNGFPAQPLQPADGDDLNNVDDEDGVSNLHADIGGTVTATVTVSGGNGILDAWMDLNEDGVFTNPTEKIFDTVHLSPGTYDLVSEGHGFGTDRLYVRFRISTAGTALPAGLAADGEVEDYMIQLNQFNRPHAGLLVEGSGEINDVNAACVSDDIWWAAHGAVFAYQVSDPVSQFELVSTAPPNFGGNSISVDVEASKQNNNASLNLRALLLNLTTGQYVPLPGVLPLTTTDAVQRFSLPAGANPTDYIHPDTGEVRLLLQTIQASGLANVRTQLDEVKFIFE